MSMNTRQLAADVGVTRATIFNWTRSGAIPAPKRRGRERIYSPGAVLAARTLAEASR